MDRVFYFFQKEIRFCVVDVNSNFASKVYEVGIVPEWEGSALLQASPNRVGFVGREILHDFNIKLELDAVNNTTKILELKA